MFREPVKEKNKILGYFIQMEYYVVVKNKKNDDFIISIQDLFFKLIQWLLIWAISIKIRTEFGRCSMEFSTENPADIRVEFLCFYIY